MCTTRAATGDEAGVGGPTPRLQPPYFPLREFEARVGALRARMDELGLSVCLLSSPENIFYLCGLDHWGYFAPHILVVPASGDMVLITRAMERVTVDHHVLNARFEGHSDSELPSDTAGRVLQDLALARSRVGIEAMSSGMPHGQARRLRHACPNAEWVDVSGLVDSLRMVKSPAEQHWIREAAHVSDASAEAAVDAIRAGAGEHEVAAACQGAMILAGGTFPGFGPFIRSTARLGEEHTTWGSTRLAAGDSVFLELSGCVARYHAPLGRLIHVGSAPDDAAAMAEIAAEAFHAVYGTLRPGTPFRDVYAAWQGVVDQAGLGHYRRHHCGYSVGIGFPPSWTGGNTVTGLRRDSERVVAAGMAFHVLSWLMGTGRGDFFISNTVLVGADGAEVLTRTPSGVTVR